MIQALKAQVAALQVLDKLDLNDGTVQHVVLASIPPQEIVPAEVRGSRHCLHVPYCLSLHAMLNQWFQAVIHQPVLYHAEHHVVLHQALTVA